jgi:iron complex transport system substrate-binding protein
VRERQRAGQALYALDGERLAEARPDLILTQRLCGVCAVGDDDVRAAVRDFPSPPRVLDLEPRSLADVLAAVRQVAEAADARAAGERLVAELAGRIARVEAAAARMARRPRVAFLEWLDPIFGGGHWNPELVRRAGGSDRHGREGEAARVVEWAEVVAARPEVLFVACCGYDVRRTREDLAALASRDGWDDLPAVRADRIHVADGARFFSRPGPGLVDSLEMLAHALDPEAHAVPAGATPAVKVRAADLRRMLAPASHQ